MLEKLEVVVNERREEEQAMQTEIEETSAKITKYRELLIADGIDQLTCLKLLAQTKLVVLNVQHVLLNIHTLMIMVKLKLGQAKAVHQL